MFVEDVTIDGFKSYAQRVTVPGFDRHFNAITGLNGTGKSNILDSICFVLGITNLSQVRASTLQDLVYKQGQAGVTKATVSITFNNEDKANSPVGYEHCDKLTVTRQVVIGGRNKYMINGSTAQPNRVQNLFHSVQLNVNNPHFLIMQGRITKVLNMKAPEILSMLEEAAGTRMYENKKEAALRTLTKKQIKMDEIDKVLQEEILPALQKLRKERGQYMQWASSGSQLEQLRRFCIAYEYSVSLEQMQETSTSKEEVASLQESLDAQKENLHERTKELKAELQQMLKERDNFVSREVKTLQAKQDDVSKELVRQTSAWTNKKETLAAELEQKSSLEKALEGCDSETLQAKFDKVKSAADKAKNVFAEVQGATQAAQCELESYKSGDSRDSSNKSLKERLAEAKTDLTAKKGEVKASDLQIKHLKKELTEAKKVAKKKDSENSKLKKELEKAESAVKSAETKIGSLDFDEKKRTKLADALQKEEGEAQKWHERVQKLQAQLSALDFQFKNPESGFDRSRVKGVVAKLLRVKDVSSNSALEVIAGGKLYQVVVDTADCAKALLEKGQLRNRVTIIPLDKISSRTLSQDKIKAAKQQVGDKAKPAISLVGYESELANAMKYVFGNAFVCKDAETAKTVTYSKMIGAHCATLDGDFYDPAGTLSGGSSKSSPSILSRLHSLTEAEKKFQTHQSNVVQLRGQVKALDSASKQYTKCKQELDLKVHSLSLLKKKIDASECTQLMNQVATLEESLEQAQATHETALEKQTSLEKSVKQLEKEVSLFGKEQKQLIKMTEDKVKKCVSNEKKEKEAMEKANQALQEVTVEIESSAADQKRLAEQIEQADATIAELNAEVESAEDEVALKKAAYEELQMSLDEKQKELSKCDKQSAQITTEMDDIQAEISNIGMEKKKLEHKLSKLEKHCQEASDTVASLLKKHPWIKSEKQYFGMPGTDYDWESQDPEETLEQLAKAEAAHNAMAKKINKKVMNMFDKAESEYNQLTEKKRIVMNDKESIEKVIAELDEKKRETLEKTWIKVNKDFGSIFSTLLPGTTARLVPPEGETFMDGLEVRVAFGDVWKESLSELSGGQRSLLALSLILALLLFKPAPIYILDEVDAALDLSHTQNIGRMIKAHFPHSQFIVVSLKEGMFNNANVLFRTKFVDGISCVSRTGSKPDQRQVKKKKAVPALGNKENQPVNV
ncbi:structural maintenance of chromosomes protein [Chloropicon primus]|uniref:Structural maintenance of chromosomes protein n=1 Tax=Chloropicon primus TaxID=1764295 RepID=A0A5B8MMZ3_9CHLO|nr:structural maintenance of chromosomes protein [Chloropicon primus]UPR01104.1 structural maintenance of chromosomes protein [Chloropicon primus]|eukprot:QDZ21883.1 structural maintenance of chromosomes protein [Chloropicon primus]